MSAEGTRRKTGGFFSSARVFSLQPGPLLEPGAVAGYHIDLRVKADVPAWPPQWVAPGRYYVSTAQWGLGCYERFLAGEGDRWLEAALETGRYLLAQQRADGGWAHTLPFPHTFRLRPPWLSAMSQGEGASLFVRLHRETGEEAYAEAAVRALGPLDVPSEAGGVRAELGGGPFYEEYPTSPPSFVLNGAIFALWGCYDVSVALGDADAERRWQEGLETLAASLGRWDLGYWSRYDLYPYPLVNVASSSYHVLHLSQLRALGRIAPRPELELVRERFERYLGSRACRARALAGKVAFRLVVPRNRLLAWRLPWTRPRRG